MYVSSIFSLVNRCTDFKDGKVNYMELIRRLGVEISPGDVVGLSTQIMYGSGQAEMRRQDDLANRYSTAGMSGLPPN